VEKTSKKGNEGENFTGIENSIMESKYQKFLEDHPYLSKSPNEVAIFDGDEFKFVYRVSGGKLHLIGKGELIELCNFYPILKRRVKKDDGFNSPTSAFEIAAYFDGNEYAALVSMEDFTTKKFFQTHIYDLLTTSAVFPIAMQAIRNAITWQGNTISIDHIYTHTGWREINGFWNFLHMGMVASEVGVKVELESKNLNVYQFSTDSLNKVEIKEILMLFYEVARAHIAKPLLAFMFLTPLCHFLEEIGEPPAFIYFLLGESGVFKSSLIGIFMCFFGNFNRTSMPASFADTFNAIEKKGFILKDMPLAVDDFHPANNAIEKSRMNTIFSKLVRMYGDRVGRGRLTQTAQMKESYPVRGTCISSGENEPNLPPSGKARLFISELNTGDVKETVLNELWNQKGKINLVMKGYIEYLTERVNEGTLTKYLKEQFIKYRSLFSSDGHARNASNSAHLMVAYNLFLKWLVSIEVMTKEMNKEESNSLFGILKRNQDVKEEEMQATAPVRVFLELLFEAISSGRVRMKKDDEIEDNVHVPLVGYGTEDEYQFLVDEAINVVNDAMKKQNRTFPAEKNMLYKKLDSIGLLIRDPKGKPTTTKRTGPKSLKRLMCLNKRAVDNYLFGEESAASKEESLPDELKLWREG
jgi:hypothetical protein